MNNPLDVNKACKSLFAIWQVVLIQAQITELRCLIQCERSRKSGLDMPVHPKTRVFLMSKRYVGGTHLVVAQLQAPYKLGSSLCSPQAGGHGTQRRRRGSQRASAEGIFCRSQSALLRGANPRDSRRKTAAGMCSALSDDLVWLIMHNRANKSFCFSASVSLEVIVYLSSTFVSKEALSCNFELRSSFELINLSV